MAKKKTSSWLHPQDHPYLWVSLGILIVIGAVFLTLQYQMQDMQANFMNAINGEQTNLKSAADDTKSKAAKLVTRKKKIKGLEMTFTKSPYGYMMEIDPTQFDKYPLPAEQAREILAMTEAELSNFQYKPLKLIEINASTGQVVGGNMYRLLAAMYSGEPIRVVKKYTRDSNNHQYYKHAYNCEIAYTYEHIDWVTHSPAVFFECRGGYGLGHDGEYAEMVYFDGVIGGNNFEVWGAEYRKLYTEDVAVITEDSYYTHRPVNFALYVN